MASENEVETEIKFYLDDPSSFEKRLLALGAECIQPRVFESNLRFDTADGSLSRSRQVLRLRRDTDNHLTYKGAALPGEQVSIRKEIEFEVSNYEAARRFLEALGYQAVIAYEKYRTTYRMDIVEVVLDELPYGHFVEIEGPDAKAVQVAAVLLKLDWSARCADSYLSLFYQLRQHENLQAQNLTFEEFDGYTFGPADLGLTHGDTLPLYPGGHEHEH
jgi:adenylate cyclase class 2